MAEGDQQAAAQPDQAAGDAQKESVPVEKWIPHPVSDHSDLDRPPPMYADDLDPNARAEFDAALSDREARLAQQEQDAAAQAGAKPKPGEKKPKPWGLKPQSGEKKPKP